MRKLSLLILLVIIFSPLQAQDPKDQQKLKSITLQAYESVSPSTRQWFVDVSEQHPPGDFDTVYAKKKLKEKFSLAQLDGRGEMFVVMMAYLKMVQKEAREDRKVQNRLKQLVLADKAAKLQMDNKAIDQGMQEAREKADRAMDAATTSLMMGIVSGAIQISAGSFSNQGNQNTVPVTKPPVLKDPVKLKIIDSTKNKSTGEHDKSTKKEPLSVYLKKLEAQLVILKKAGI